MMSLFFSFDYFIFYKSFFLIFFLIFNLFSLFYYHSLLSYIFNFLFNLLENSLLKLKLYCNKMSIFILILIFSYMFMLNFFSIFSYIFPLTSQFSLVMFFSLLIWLSFNIFYFFNNSKSFISHFVPESCPILICLFIFLIEMVSSIIRPLTLSIRISANILTGHVLMILLSNFIFFFNYAFFLHVALSFIEMLVSLVQAYIFFVLTSLYLSEIN